MAQRENQEKRLRTTQSLEELEEAANKSSEKHLELHKSLGDWTKILKLLTASDREQKPEEERWVDYLRKISGSEMQEFPKALLQQEMEYADVVIYVSGQISQLRKLAGRALNASARHTKRKAIKEAAAAKKDAKLKKKVEVVLEDPEVKNVKVANLKHLVMVHMCSRLWFLKFKWGWGQCCRSHVSKPHFPPELNYEKNKVDENIRKTGTFFSKQITLCPGKIEDI